MMMLMLMLHHQSFFLAIPPSETTPYLNFFGVHMFPTSKKPEPQEVFRHDVLNRSDVHQVSRLGLGIISRPGGGFKYFLFSHYFHPYLGK